MSWKPRSGIKARGKAYVGYGAIFRDGLILVAPSVKRLQKNWESYSLLFPVHLAKVLRVAVFQAPKKSKP